MLPSTGVLGEEMGSDEDEMDDGMGMVEGQMCSWR